MRRFAKVACDGREKEMPVCTGQTGR